MTTERTITERVRNSVRYGVIAGLSLATAAACGGSSSTRKPLSAFAWGPRIRLTADTFGRWDSKHPEPVVSDHSHDTPPSLFVGDDGRFNYPSNPNPDTDTPTGLYSKPTQKSHLVTSVQDGTVLKAVGYTGHGQPVSDAHGGLGNPTWEEVVSHTGKKAWVPEVNVGWTALRELHQLPQIDVGSSHASNSTQQFTPPGQPTVFN